MKVFLSRATVCVGCFLVYGVVCSQPGGRVVSGQNESVRAIITSVPFLQFAPDGRASGAGDTGVATTPGPNAVHWNNAKLPFYKKNRAVSFSYTPWLARLIDDMYIGYLSGVMKFNDLQAVAFSLRYFDLGDIYLTDDSGNSTGTLSPRDFALDASYARKLSDQWGVGITMRFLQSNLSRGYSQGQAGSNANGIAVDIGTFYINEENNIFGKPGSISYGLHISNLGNKISYNNEANENFIPANLRLGFANSTLLDADSRLSVFMDLNKLLVPTPPIYRRNEHGVLERNEDGSLVIERGVAPDRPVLNAVFTSFSDAPNGFVEELQEINISGGAEYSYQDFFFFRTGYHHQPNNKGNRKYATIGAGFQYNVFGIDFSYLLPLGRNHPLAETIRFSMVFSFDKAPTQSSSRKSTPSTPEEEVITY